MTHTHRTHDIQTGHRGITLDRTHQCSRTMGKLHILMLLVVKTATTQGYGQKQSQTQPEKVKNFEDLYSEGKEAYLDNNFKDCVTKIEAASRDFKFYTETVSKCKLKCNRKSEMFPSVLKHSPEIVPFEKLIHETLCVMKCKQKTLSKTRVENIEEKTRTDFETKKPYDFLQLCYYQTGDHQNAANAAFTNLVYNSDHEAMRENLKFYMALPEVDENSVKNLESPDYVEQYLVGTDHYRSEDWKRLIETMEGALKEYLLAEELCRVNCDKPFDMGWYPDFKSSVANHFTFCLKCKMNCAQNLNNFNGEYMDDLLPSFYHYLQFAYFKVGKVDAAAQCTGTYLYLNPDQEDMKGNAVYYKEVEGVNDKWFLPREEAVAYVERDQDEQALLDFIENNYIFDEKEEDSEPEINIENSSSENAVNLDTDEFVAKISKNPHGRKSNAMKVLDMNNWDFPEENEFFTETATKQLNPDIILAKQCQQLLDIAQLVAHSGDGYINTPMDRGLDNPHTGSEILKGITIGKLALFVYYGLVDWRYLETLLENAEIMRTETQERLSPDETIYSTYTHLVCRIAKPGPKVRSQTEMSHAFHADNCQLKRNECDPSPPSYSYRDYSALLYLNKEFSGGNLVFADRDKVTGKLEITDTVIPQCGKMVVFTSGPESIHGVKPIITGERCALAMWYSLNKTFEEPEIELARKLIDFIKADETPPEVIKKSLEDLTMFDEKQAKAIAVVNGIKKPGHF